MDWCRVHKLIQDEWFKSPSESIVYTDKEWFIALSTRMEYFLWHICKPKMIIKQENEATDAREILAYIDFIRQPSKFSACPACGAEPDKNMRCVYQLFKLEL